MIVNPQVLKELKDVAGSDREERAEDYVNRKRVNIKKVIYDNINNFEVRSKVRGNQDIYDVYIKVMQGEIENIECTCEDYHKHYATCKHILATALEFNKNENYVRIFSGDKEEKQSDIEVYKKYTKKDEKYRNFKQLINTFYPGSQEEKEELKNKIEPHSIKIEPKLIYNSYLKTLKLEVKIGDKQLYKIKNFSEFYDRMLKKEFYRYGSKLEFVHEKDVFDLNSIKLLEFILKYSEIIKYANEATNQYTYYGRTMEDSYITISNSGMDELFEALEGKEVLYQKEGKEEKVLFLKAIPNIKFSIKEDTRNEYYLCTNIDDYEYELIEGKEYTYFEQGNILYRCDEKFKNTTLKLLQVFKNNLTNSITFPKTEISKLFSVVFPKVRNQIEIDNLNEEEIEKYVPKELYVKVYLDYNESNYITADIKFVYGEDEFNPLIEQEINIPRDVAKEDEVLEIFRKSGFMLDVKKARLILVKDEYIYQFLSEDIEMYMKKFEVLATDNFKQKEIKKPKIGTLGIRIENNLLNIDFSNLDFDPKEIKEIMQKYHEKKKYHRLKDGSFLELEENDTIEFLDSITKGMDISYKELEKGELRLPVYRSLYLDRILETLENVSISKSEQYKDLINKVEEKETLNNIKIPENLNASLRTYQKVGYEWLKVIDEYGFGGILADDMGLRKNYSIISSSTRLCTKK